MKEQLILVNDQDQEVGKLDKWNVHVQGLLHRAFSIFVFNSKGELLLQQRAEDKYHSGGLWTNTCCSHPNFGETTEGAAVRRLEEEMGLQCAVDFKFKFKYRAAFENGLIEHELDYVFFGFSDKPPVPNVEEVKTWKYVSLEELHIEMEREPEQFTEWLKICYPEVRKFVKINSQEQLKA